MVLDSMRAEEEAKLKGGEDAVAWVKEELCIGCDQCTIVCDDDAIELYDKAMTSPLIQVDINRKAKVLRDPCTGCRLCVLACPTDAKIWCDESVLPVSSTEHNSLPAPTDPELTSNTSSPFLLILAI